jgi:hypothetical protein
MGEPPRPSPGRGPGRSLLRDHQRAAVLAIAAGLPDEKRRTFLERLNARLEQRGSRPSDAELDKAIRIALKGLVHQPAA